MVTSVEKVDTLDAPGKGRLRRLLPSAALAAVFLASGWAYGQDAVPAVKKDETKAEAKEQDKAPDMTQPAWPVSGIYTAADTKDVGKILKAPALENLKIRGWVDAYYLYNTNTPKRTAVDANNGFSIIKGRNVSVEGRTFDVHHNQFALSLAEIELELVPNVGEVGFKLDMAFGETQDIYNDSIRAALDVTGTGDTVTDFDKTFPHASVSYKADIGNGLRIDFGKFVTHIGGETIETVKNWNYSHSYFYTYAIPFQDTGIRLNYPLSDTFYVEFYALNGWNVTVDNNEQKTVGPSIGWTAAPWISWYANVLVGGERTPSTSSGQRILFDTQLFVGPIPGMEKLSFLVNFDYGKQEDAFTDASGSLEDATWWGIAFYARYKVTDNLEPSLRVELYNDDDGWTTNTLIDPATGDFSPAAPLEENRFTSVTFTLNYRVGINKGSVLLVRPEIRWDGADENFFTDRRVFRDKDSQLTFGLGVSWMF